MITSDLAVERADIRGPNHQRMTAMAFLRSIDGTLYEIPEEDLAEREIPHHEIEKLLAELGVGGDYDPGPPPATGDAPQVVILVTGESGDFDPGPPVGSAPD